MWALQPTGAVEAEAAGSATGSSGTAQGYVGCSGTAQRPWRDLATAEEGDALRGCRVLLSRAARERTVPELACWRCWLVLVRRGRWPFGLGLGL